jgi:arsenate reductase (glutaredoxin)
MITLYGIPNCDTVKSARDWLDERKVAYTFHNFKTDGLESALVNAWMSAIGWETLVNRKGTSWRRLDGAMQQGIRDANSARGLILSMPSVVKRPVVQWGDMLSKETLTVGFDEVAWAERVAGLK